MAFYVFGVFLIVSGVRMAVAREAADPEKSRVLGVARRLCPVSRELVGEQLVVRLDGRLTLTPLAMALILIESSDLMFAIDSIPAIFAITDDPFLVFTSNIMAILGLRSLYFALAGIIQRFYYLKVSLALLMALIGAKMLLKDVLQNLPGTTEDITLTAPTSALTWRTLAQIAADEGGDVAKAASGDPAAEGQPGSTLAFGRPSGRGSSPTSGSSIAMTRPPTRVGRTPTRATSWARAGSSERTGHGGVSSHRLHHPGPGERRNHEVPRLGGA